VQWEDGVLTPQWSGMFYVLDGDEVGLMAVHVADRRTHKAPGGWALDAIEMHDDSEVYLYRKAAA
jgi:hypothetical protein